MMIFDDFDYVDDFDDFDYLDDFDNFDDFDDDYELAWDVVWRSLLRSDMMVRIVKSRCFLAVFIDPCFNLSKPNTPTTL